MRFFVVAWALVAGLTACRDYDFDLWQNDDAAALGDSAYMSISFAIAGENTMPTRAASSEGHPDDAPDFGPYSFTWEEAGNDPINKVLVYVFYEKDGAFFYEKTKEFNASDLELHNGDWRLKKAFNTTAGKKKVFVVVNPTASVEENIKAKLTRADSNTPSEYERYEKFDEYLHSAGVHTFKTDNHPTSHVLQSRADELVGANGGILMTGEAVETTIVAGVAEATVQSTTSNNPKITVERAAARVLVTMPYEVGTKTLEEVKKLFVDGNENRKLIIHGNDGKGDIAYVTDVTWRVAQGAKDFYFIKHKSAQNQEFTLTSYYNPKWQLGVDYPEYGDGPGPDTIHVSLPTEEMPNPPQVLPEYGADGKPITDIWNEVYPDYAHYTESFDYSGLWKTPKRPPVTREEISTPDEDERGEMLRDPDRRKDIAEETYIKREKKALRGVQGGYEYVLPTSPMPQYANNAYVIIKAKIIPLVWYENNETVSAIVRDANNMPKANKDFAPSYDEDGGFYFQPLNVETLNSTFSKEPLDGMVNIYLKGGYAYWCVPINPSNRYRRLRNIGIDPNDGIPVTEKPFWGADVAPIMRNAYYHLQIGYFRRIGLNWNPFVPYLDGTVTPETSNPHNPDPRPSAGKDNPEWLPAYLPNDALKNNVFNHLREVDEGLRIWDINSRKKVFYKGDTDYTQDPEPDPDESPE